ERRCERGHRGGRVDGGEVGRVAEQHVEALAPLVAFVERVDVVFEIASPCGEAAGAALQRVPDLRQLQEVAAARNVSGAERGLERSLLRVGAHEYGDVGPAGAVAVRPLGGPGNAVRLLGVAVERANQRYGPGVLGGLQVATVEHG